MSTKDLALAYYRCINARDLEGVLALFADDACFNLPDGRTVAGKEAIRAMYVGVFGAGGPQPQPVTIVPAAAHVAAEVQVTLADGSVRKMASFFALGEGGRFSGVTVYQRG